jgi:hypothetical protein
MTRFITTVYYMAALVVASIPARAEGSKCRFDLERAGGPDSEVYREVSDPLRPGWVLGFEQDGEERSILLNMGVFGGGGAALGPGQRLTLRFSDGTSLQLFSTNTSTPALNGNYAEYSFRFLTTMEALRVIGSLPLESFGMVLPGEAQHGVPTASGRKKAKKNANCIQDHRHRD